MRSEVADPRAATPGPAVALHEINSGAERSRDCLEFGQHDPGYAGEGGRLAGLGDAHVTPNAEENKGVLHAHPPLAGEQPGSLPTGLPHGIRVLDGGAVGDPSVLRFADRPLTVFPFQQVEPDRDLPCYLDSCPADLAIAHAGVHVSDSEHSARLSHGEVDLRSYAMEVVIEVATVLAWHGVDDLLPLRGNPDNPNHRPYWKPDLVAEVYDSVPHGQNFGNGRVDQVYELAVARDDGCHPLRPGSDIQDLDHEAVAGFCASDGDRTGGRVHLREVDVGDQVVLSLDLAREAVVGLEGNDLPWAYLQDRLHLRAEGEDGLFLRDGVINPLDRLGHANLLPNCLSSRFPALRSRLRRISPPLEQWPVDAARQRAQGPRNPRLSR